MMLICQKQMECLIVAKWKNIIWQVISANSSAYCSWAVQLRGGQEKHWTVGERMWYPCEPLQNTKKKEAVYLSSIGELDKAPKWGQAWTPTSLPIDDEPHCARQNALQCACHNSQQRAIRCTQRQTSTYAHIQTRLMPHTAPFIFNESVEISWIMWYSSPDTPRPS